ncbi:MAG TPA: hypothetical protein VD816_07435 [Ohtaekwangia sp.]|nr:hypothetical protein [Ohtaekwangia sp.]
MRILFVLHFLNLSIDARDPKPDTIPENLAMNDIESLAEFIAEVVFNWRDAFAEHDERDNDGGGAADFFKFYPSGLKEINVAGNSYKPSVKVFFIIDSGNTLPAMRDIVSPPPRA